MPEPQAGSTLRQSLRTAAGEALPPGPDGPDGTWALLDASGRTVETARNYGGVMHRFGATAKSGWLESLPAELRSQAAQMLAEVASAGSADRILPVLPQRLRWLRLRLQQVQTEAGPELILAMVDDLTELDEKSLVAQLIRDPLTGLLNRRAFLELAALPAESTARYAGVLAVDVRRFRRINEVWGRAAGDACLVETSRWLRSITDSGDLLIRLADAEFFVLLGKFSTAPVALAAEPQRNVDLGTHSLQLSLQAGFATGEVLRETAERAEVALAEAKREAWRSVVPWTRELAVVAARAARDEEAVHQAVLAGAQAVYFQPIVDLRSRRVSGVEGLVRLGGAAADVPAGQILQASHRLGLTPLLAERVYDLAFTDGMRLREVFPGCQLGINVSREFLATGLAIDTVLASAQHCGVDSSQIALELTEDAAAGLSSERLLSELDKGAAAGLHIVIDDFGQGETSLSLLRTLPLSAIKLDRSLLPADAADERGWDFVAGVIALLSRICGRLVAEGIETPEQAVRLLRLGVHLQQGYLFGAPQPADHWLSQGFQLPALD
ncbi:MAG TPA: bifunctional diguanylate cyclase/phosphodiesterase [Jatrophihabitans sp.]|nr:bifunctional diguanylate cyclase/phosphodiesterase [Jatrophihabitans sp.]